MKKLLSFVCVVAMLATMLTGMAMTANAADNAVVKAEFAGFDVKSETSVFAKINVTMTIPGTFSPYQEICDDSTNWETVLTGRVLGSYAVNLKPSDTTNCVYNSGLSTAPVFGNKAQLNSSTKDTVFATLIDNAANGYSDSTTLSLGTVYYKLAAANFNTDTTYDIDVTTMTEIYVMDYTTGSYISEGYTTALGNLTLTGCTIPAYKTVTEYNVTYATATNGTVTGAATTTDGKVNVTVTPNAGYEVASLTVGGVAQNIANIKNGGTVELTLEADAEIAATFVKVAPWDVTYTAATNGTVTGAAKTDADGKVAVTVTPAKGYKVASVTVDGVAQNISALDAKVGGTLNLTLTKDATIAATFAEIELAVVTYANVYNDADGVAVFGKYEGTATAAGIYLAKGGAAVTHANAADGKYANAKAAADKYFGVMWTGLEAGTYAANAYADAANGAVVNFTVAE